MEVRYQRADVARAVVARMQAAQIRAVGFRKTIRISFSLTEYVLPVAPGIFMLEKVSRKAPDFGPKREAENTLAGGAKKMVEEP